MREWTWQTIHEIAGIAGVDPWDYSLRELVWRYDAIRMEQWDHTAWLCFHIPRWGKTRKTPIDFNPLRMQERQTNIAKLNAWIDEVSDKLPETLSTEDFEKQFEAAMTKGN